MRSTNIIFASLCTKSCEPQCVTSLKRPEVKLEDMNKAFKVLDQTNKLTKLSTHRVAWLCWQPTRRARLVTLGLQATFVDGAFPAKSFLVR